MKVGFAAILAFASGIVLLWVLGYLPGIVGRTFTLITGFLWTPFIMEPLLFIGGFMVLLIINHNHQKRQGPELVEIESNDPAQLKSSSDQSTKPLDKVPAGNKQLSAIEKAAASGNHKEALRLMIDLTNEESESEEAIAIRLRMAMANRDPNSMRGLRKKLRQLNPDHPLLSESEL